MAYFLLLELLVVDIEVSDGEDGIAVEVVLLIVLASFEEPELLKMPSEEDRLSVVARSWEPVNTGGCETAALRANAKIKQYVERCIVRSTEYLGFPYLPG